MTDERQPALPESADEELARLRRVAIVDELLTTLVGVLDVREVFAQVSAVAGRVLQHDAIALPVFTEDRQHAIPFATAGPAAVAYPTTHPIPELARYLLTDPWEFEIIDDLQADPEREPHSASLGYRSLLRVPIRLQGEVIALLVVQSRTPALYQPADATVARRIADYVALALSHQRLADRARSRNCEPERRYSSWLTICLRHSSTRVNCLRCSTAFPRSPERCWRTTRSS